MPNFAKIGFDGECYTLYINDEWQETSVLFSDVKESAEEAGFRVDATCDEGGYPIAQPTCVFVGKKSSRDEIDEIIETYANKKRELDDQMYNILNNWYK